MCRRQEEDNTPKEKQLEDGLIAIVKAQLETHTNYGKLMNVCAFCLS